MSTDVVNSIDKREKLREFFDRKVEEFNRPAFIANDPISVPHLFDKKQDIEIAGFFASIFAWGNRKTIIQKSKELMQLMDMSPHAFCVGHEEMDLQRMLQFKHRTFNPTDLLYFISFLQFHYKRYDSLEAAFTIAHSREQETIESGLNSFYSYFFSLEHVPPRTRKHITAPQRKSTCKRLNMFLRWMVRSDAKGVDFGIWKRITPAQLVCPVDIHVARVARRFGLLNRNQTDWQSAVDLTHHLKRFDPADPVKYDFALFGLGAMERFS